MEKYLFIEYRKVKTSDFQIPDFTKINQAEFLEVAKLAISELNSEQRTFYPQSFRLSFFAQIFSVLEFELKEICKIFQQVHNTDYSLNDLKGNSEIEKAKLFLIRSAKINFSQLEPEWNYLNTSRKIRNIIIHHRGEISQENNDWKAIRQFIEKNRQKIGFSNSAEYLESKQFEKVFDKDCVFNIEIHNLELNEDLIIMIKSFLHKLALLLDKELS